MIAETMRPETRDSRAVPERFDLSGEHLGWATPPEVREAAKRALEEGATHYTTRPGLNPLRVAVAQKLHRENGIDVDPQAEVLITCGAQEALFVTLHVLLSPRDEVMVPQPANPAYMSLVRHAHGAVRAAPGSSLRDFALDLDAIQGRLTKRSRALLLPDPGVPAGTVADETTLRHLATIAQDHNLIVIADESYESLVFEGSHRSIGSLPGMAERTITINGFSVPYGMSAWRVGYVVGPKHLIGPIMQLKQALSICSPAVSQYAALAALQGSQQGRAEMWHTVRRRRDVVVAALTAAGVPHVRPAAGPFVLLDGSRTGLAGTALARHVAERSGVRLASGREFGDVTSSWLRLTLSQPEGELLRAVEHLRPVLGGDIGGAA